MWTQTNLDALNKLFFFFFYVTKIIVDFDPSAELSLCSTNVNLVRYTLKGSMKRNLINFKRSHRG